MELAKSELLAKLEIALRQGDIDAADLEALCVHHRSAGGSTRAPLVLAILGGIIAFSGLGVLIAQHWHLFGSMMRVFLTLGAGFVGLGTGMSLSTRAETRGFAPILYVLALLLIPSGIMVTAHEAGFRLSQDETQIAMALFAALSFGPAAILCRSNTLAIGTVWSLTWLFIAVTNLLLPEVGFISTTESYQYRSLVIGAAYLSLAFGARGSDMSKLSGVLYFLGSSVILATSYSLMRWRPDQNILWELVYPALCAGFIHIGAQERLRSFVANGALALNLYIAKLSMQYFADSIGWPLTMIFAGIGMIVIATTSVELYRGSRFDGLRE